MNVAELMQQHATLKTDWRRHLESLESGGLQIRTASGADVTTEAIHFMRSQIMKLESIDRLMIRLSPGH